MPKTILIIGSGNLTAKHLISLLLKRDYSIKAVYRKTPPAFGSEFVKEIQGDVTKDDPSGWMNGCFAVVYLAGGDESEENAVDNIGAARTAESAEKSGVHKFIYISALGAHDPNSWGEEFKVYLEARAKGEEAVKARNLSWSILRPGILNNDPGAGTISTAMTEDGDANISRSDVAETIACAIETSSVSFKAFDVVAGTTPISVALSELTEIVEQGSGGNG